MYPCPKKQALGQELRKLRKTDPEKLQAILSNLSEKEAEEILYDWEIWCRPKQWYTPKEANRITFWMAGRGWGKTATGTGAVKSAINQGAKRIALVAPTSADVRDTMLFGESGLMEAFPPKQRPEYQPSYRRVVFPNGAVAWLYSAEEPERLRGPQHDFGWMDEPGSMGDMDIFRQLMFGLRLGMSKLVVTGTPRKGNEIVLELIRRTDVKIISGTTYENEENLSSEFMEEMKSAIVGTRYEKQELLGKMMLESENALWTSDLIEKQRFKGEIPPMSFFAIGVDPAVSKKKGSDSTGIVGVGLGEDGFGYVLDDLTGKYTPHEWARKVVALYDQYSKQAPCVIIAERNQGGNMVESTLHNERVNLPVRTTFATKDKITRATPVAMLYEQGKVYHTRVFEELESEMCMYDGTGKHSPDRLDALSCALTEAMLGKKNKAVIKELLF